jgi:hypothetical protein
MKTGAKALMLATILLCGAAVGGWSLIALIAGLRQADWQVTELLRQYLVATGIVKPTHTLVDFYSHIKGIEYLICVAFFVAFPLFYRYVNEDTKRIKTK